jgi:transglutaminase-like putative cysteine protease
MKLESSVPSRKFIFILALLTAFSVRADTTDTNLYIGSRWALVDAKPVLAAAARITPAAYPDCDDVTVEQKSVRVYQTDGTGGCQDETFLKVLTEKGKRNDRTIGLGFMLPYTTVSVPALEIIKPDGRIVPVNVAANSKESIDASQMAENIYDPNMKVLKVNIPGLEIGDIVHSVTRETIERPIVPGQYAEENIFEGAGFIRHITYEVYAPADRPLKSIALRDEVPGTVVSSVHPGADHTLVYRWEVNDVPRMYDEPDMPPYENVLQRLCVSTLPDWTAVSEWYWNISQSHLKATTPEMKQAVEKLTAGVTNDTEKIKALFYFVSNQIRYMGITPEKDRPGFEPHDVSITFNKAYGVCRDKAALLVSMLRLAGFEAYPILINVGTRMDPQVPDPFFNHAIVAAELKDGQQVLMDPTDENTRELLPAYDRHQSYLVCRAEGATLDLSPVQPADDNLMRVETTGVLNADGVIDAKTELSFQGVNDDEYRNAFANMRQEDIRRFFERNLEVSLPGARLQSFRLIPTNLFDMATGLRAELHFTVPGMTANGGGKSVATLPWLGRQLGIANFILNGTGLAKRKYPLDTQYTCGSQEEISLKLGDGFAGLAALPAPSSVDDDGVSYQERFASRTNSITCSRTLKLKVVEFSPAQYLNLKHVLQTMANDERKAPVLALAHPPAEVQTIVKLPAAPTPTSDARILESRKELDVTGPDSAVYRVEFKKLILTYNGKIQESQVRIPYNPACEQARLVHATVTSVGGARQEISPEEINVMDQAWNASAKRYTGGRVLVASLPGVEIGSMIDVAFEVTMSKKMFLSGFESFQLPQELRQKSFTLTAPAGLKIQRLISGTPGIIHGQDMGDVKRQTFQWQAENVGALPAENRLPPEWTYAADVGYFVGDLTNYLAALEETLLARSQHSTEAAALARQLAAKAESQLDAVKAIRDYVAKSIRLAGPPFTELPLDELSDADETLADGYGHVADRAILLYAMLEAAGFQPQFVLASELPAITGITNAVTAFPMPQDFQTPLVRVTLDGVDYYLNDTDQYAQLGTTPHDGRLALALPSPALEVIHAATGCENETRTDYTLLLDDSGRTVLNISRQYYGENYNQKRKFFAELRPEERDRYFQEAVSGVAQGARALGQLTTDFDTYPGREQFMVAIDDYGVPAGKYFYFDLPFTPTLIAPDADQRALPLYVPQADKDIVRLEVDLPPDFQRALVLPRNADYAVAGGETARIRVASTFHSYTITDELQTVPAIISPAAYQTLLKVESDLSRKSSKVFLLEQK